jgi:hypothetical protein
MGGKNILEFNAVDCAVPSYGESINGMPVGTEWGRSYTESKYTGSAAEVAMGKKYDTVRRSGYKSKRRDTQFRGTLLIADDSHVLCMPPPTDHLGPTDVTIAVHGLQFHTHARVEFTPSYLLDYNGMDVSLVQAIRKGYNDNSDRYWNSSTSAETDSQKIVSTNNPVIASRDVIQPYLHIQNQGFAGFATSKHVSKSIDLDWNAIYNDVLSSPDRELFQMKYSKMFGLTVGVEL